MPSLRRKYLPDSDKLSDSSSDEDDSRRGRRRGYKKFKQAEYKAKYTLKQAQTKKDKSQAQGPGVYVLYNPTTNMRYVGKSNNVEARIEQHQQAEEGCLVREKPLTTGSAGDLESWERNEVLTRLYRHGMDSVRGWRYTRKDSLSMEERVSARNDIMEKFDLCRRCGRNNHFAVSCFAKTPAFWCQDIPM